MNTFGRDIQHSRTEFVCFNFHEGLLFHQLFHLSNQTPKILQILTLYQVNAETLMPVSKEGTIFTKDQYECKRYSF